MKLFREMFLDGMKRLEQERFGIDKMSDEKVFTLAYSIVSITPTERMTAFVDRLSKSDRATDRLKAQQMSMILFAQAEIEKVLTSLSPKEAEQMFDELLSEKTQQGGTPA